MPLILGGILEWRKPWDSAERGPGGSSCGLGAEVQPGTHGLLRLCLACWLAERPGFSAHVWQLLAPSWGELMTSSVSSPDSVATVSSGLLPLLSGPQFSQTAPKSIKD